MTVVGTGSQDQAGWAVETEWLNEFWKSEGFLDIS